MMQDYFYNENKNKHESHVNLKLIKVNKSLEFFTNCILHLDIFIKLFQCASYTGQEQNKTTGSTFLS